MKALLSISLIVSMLFQSFGYSIQAIQYSSAAREDISQVETPVSPSNKLQEVPLPDDPVVTEPTATLKKEPTLTPEDKTEPAVEETATTDPAEEKAPTETPTSSEEEATATSTPLGETLEPSVTPTTETTPTETATPLPDIDIDDTVEKALVTSEGAKITAFSKQLTITFPAKASEEALEISVKRPNPEEKGMEFDEQAFEITALGMDSKAEVSKFAAPIKLEVQYDPELFGNHDLVMTYYDEEQKDWLPLFSVTDPASGILYAWTDHFTIFNYDVEDYGAPGNIDVEGFQVASFTGAATYELPLELPDGPGGFKPDLTLRYNSQIVDMNRIRKQGAWVGKGWDLDVPYIGRNTYGTSDLESDDTFFLYINGSAHTLGIDSADYYRTLDETYYRIKSISNGFQMWDGEGNYYEFYHKATYPRFSKGSGDLVGYKVWRYSLTTMQNKNGVPINFTYTMGSKMVEPPGGGNRYSFKTAVYVDTITYGDNRYQVTFSRTERGDISSSWRTNTSRTWYMAYALDKIEVRYDMNGDGTFGETEIIKTFDFTYAGDGEQHIFPNFTWSTAAPNNLPTLTLLKMQEFGLNGSSLPPMTFHYDDNMHLTRVENGYGGTVEYVYEAATTEVDGAISSHPWGDLETIKTLRKQNDIGASGAACSGSNGLKNWKKGTGSTVTCKSGRLSVIGDAYWKMDDDFGEPGKLYFIAAAPDANYNTDVHLGLRFDDQIYTHGEEIPGGIWVETWSVFPSISSTREVYLNIHCETECQISKVRAKQLLTVYRVTEKHTTDEVTGKEQVFTYRYDSPATNSPDFSWATNESGPYYIPRYAQYIGNSSVNQVAPDGTVTTTYFYQDDGRRGRQSVEITHTQSFWDPFNAVDADQWGGTAATATNKAISSLDVGAMYNNNDGATLLEGDVLLTGDSSLRVTGGVFTRGTHTLQDGQTVMVQFLAPDVSTAVTIQLVSGSQSFGIDISNGEIKTSGSNPQTLIDTGNFKTKKWYVAMLNVDGADSGIHVWERDFSCVNSDGEPISCAQTCISSSGSTISCAATLKNLDDYTGDAAVSVAAGETWHFETTVTTGDLWLDEYSEGSVYSFSQTYVRDDRRNPSHTPATSETYNCYYDGHIIYWARPVESRTFNLEGGGEWLATGVQYEYDKTNQGGTQYGNLTKKTEMEWADGAWVPYRMTRINYYPYVTNTSPVHYLVKLPGVQSVYRCDGGVCSESASALEASTQYLYDGHTSYTALPSNGILTGQRSLLRFAGASFTDPRYHDTTYAYDSWGNLTSTTEFSGEGTEASLASSGAQTTSFTYDSLVHAHRLSQTNALNQTTAWAYDYVLGVPVSETDPNGAVTTAAYDDFGRITAIRRPGDESGAPTLTIGYYDNNYTGSGEPFLLDLTQKVNDTFSKNVRKYYNGLGQLLQQQTANAVLAAGVRDILVSYDYDAFGRVIRQTVPIDDGYAGGGFRLVGDWGANAPAHTYTEYDPMGRVTGVWTPDQKTVLTDYAIVDGELRTTVTDVVGNVTQSFADRRGRTLEVVPATGPGVSYTYDALDRLVQAVYGAAQTSISYDQGGRKTALQDPDLGAWSYAYNALGSLTSQTDARGCTVSLTYDSLNRLTGKSYAGSCAGETPVTYAYDLGSNGIGQRTGMQDASGSTQWSYDARGRMTGEVKTIGSDSFATAWTYNAADWVATLTYPADNLGNSGETVTYGYYPQGSLNTVNGTDNYQSSASYDTAGRLLQRDLSNGTLQSSYTYYPWDAQITGGDTLGRLAAVQSGATLTPASLQDLAYHYDPLGNVTAVVDQLAGPQTHAFSYDALNRLVSAEAAGGQDGLYSESYSYDAATGNLAGKGGTSYGYQDAAHAHAVTHLDGTAAYSYDANGNMLQRTVGSDVYTFTYTAENKLATAALNGTPLASYVYDGDGQRVSAAVNGVTTRMLDGRFEYDGTLTIYYNAGGQRIALRKAGVLRYLFNDHLGSTSVTSDAAGNSVAELRYRAFGQTRFALGSTPTSLRFTGQRQAPELGLYDYGARFYDPALGRFIQPDSLVPQPGNPLAWDRYGYVYNNPVNRIDPSGHDPWYCNGNKECMKNDFTQRGYTLGYSNAGQSGPPLRSQNNPPQLPKMPNFQNPIIPKNDSNLEGKCTPTRPCINSWEQPGWWNTNPKDPDYYTVSGSVGTTYGGFTALGAIDRYGNTYLGFGGNIGKSISIFSGTFNNGWIGSSVDEYYPDPAYTSNFLEGISLNGQIGAVGDLAITVSPFASRYVNHKALEYGTVIPYSVGLSFVYSFKIIDGYSLFGSKQ